MLDQMEEMLYQGRHIPFSPYRVVRAQEFEQLIERVRISVPSAIREGERTLSERDRILEDAQVEANRIIQDAQRRAKEVVSDDALLQTAREESERILAESKRSARHRADEADQYATQVLQDLKSKLDSMMQQVDNGIGVMQQKSERREAAGPEARQGPRST